MTRRHVSIATTAALAVTGGLFWATPGQAAPAAPGSSATCPAAHPVADLTLGQQVTGLTSAGAHRRNGPLVDSSVTPEPFTGEYRGSVEDGVGEILVFELEGSRITKADGSVDAGIWAGMSGSPVYAADGRLVGAVAYAFSDAQSTNFAGVTPAAQMYTQLGRRNGEDAASPRVRLDAGERRALTSQGLPAAQAAAGLVRLDPTLTFAGGRHQVSPKLRAKGARNAGGTGSTQSERIPLVPGGNVAFAGSTGSVALFTVGTVTAVCGDEVLAYGHPNGIGWGANSMHGARTVFVQANGGAGYKVSNLAAPVGTQTYDGTYGVNGRLGTTAKGTEVVVSTRFNGGPRATTRSSVSDSYWTGTVAAEQTARDLAQSMGAISKGSVRLAWTMDVTRANGSPATVRGATRLTSRDSLNLAAGEAVFEKVEGLALNLVEPVTVRKVTISADAASSLDTRLLRKIQVRTRGTWKSLPRSGRLKVPGKPRPIKVRVTASSVTGSSLAPVSKVFTFTPGRGSATVDFRVTSSMDYFEPGVSATDWESLVAALRPQPVAKARVTMTTADGRERSQPWRTGAIVMGELAGSVRFKKARATAQPPVGFWPEKPRR